MTTKTKPHVKLKKEKTGILSPFATKIINEFQNKQNPPNKFNNFKMPEQFGKTPTITTDNGAVFDNNSLPINSCGQINQSELKSLVNSYFMGYPAYSILSQNGILQNIIQSYAQQCVRKWVEIKSRSNSKDNKHDKIKAIHKRMEELKVKDNYRLATEMMVMFGGCKMYHKIKGDDLEDEYLTPLYIKQKVKKGDLLYIKVVEPLYATPLNFNTTNPLSENFYEPQEWNILTTTLHTSRLCHFSYNYVPTLLKPVYWFNGMPLIQLVLSYLIGFESVRKDIINVVSRYNINVFSTSLDALLNYDGNSTFQDGEDCYSRLKLAQAIMSNFSIFAMDNNPEAPETWQQFNMTIAGLSEILSQNAELVCAACRMPSIILYGTSPKGFNSTGDVELRTFYDLISSIQEANLLPSLQITFNLIQMDLFGEIDDDLFIEFNPLWTMSELDQSQINLNTMNTDVGYATAGIIATQEIRQKLAANPKSGYDNLMSDVQFDSLMDEMNEEEKRESQNDSNTSDQ